MWLRDFLPEKVSNARVLLYGYNADLIGPGAGSFASILDMGRALMNQLIIARERPEVRIVPGWAGTVVDCLCRKRGVRWF
jgi:hypothetical protein